jgi:hypothetical protein
MSVCFIAQDKDHPILRCAICGACATANLSFTGVENGNRCEECLHQTLSVHRVVTGLVSSSTATVDELARTIDHFMSTMQLRPECAALLLRLRAALGAP